MNKKPVQSIIDPLTGEELTPESDPKILSEALKRLVLETKKLETPVDVLKKWLMPYAEKAYQDGDKRFMDYWTLAATSGRFNEKLFLEKADPRDIAYYTQQKVKIEKIESKLDLVRNNAAFRTEGTVYLKVPQLS